MVCSLLLMIWKIGLIKVQPESNNQKLWKQAKVFRYTDILFSLKTTVQRLSYLSFGLFLEFYVQHYHWAMEQRQSISWKKSFGHSKSYPKIGLYLDATHCDTMPNWFSDGLMSRDKSESQEIRHTASSPQISYTALTVSITMQFDAM